MISTRIEKKGISRKSRMRRRGFKKKGKKRIWKGLGNKKTLSYLEEESLLTGQIKLSLSRKRKTRRKKVRRS